MNKNTRFANFLAAIVCVLMAAGSAYAAEAEKPASAKKVKVLVLVGGHGFDQASFDKFWSGLEDIDSHIWKGNPYTAFDDVSQFHDDVIVMYNHQTFCEGIHVLISTDHPRSDKTIAWVHPYGKARVFGYQSGHDAKVWTDANFQRLMAQGMRWASGRVPDAEKK
jgi:opacity protein-like surface antigen